MRRVEVLWRDAATYEGDYELKPDVGVGALMRDVGWVVQVKDGYITLALERYEEDSGHYRHVMDIPLINVVEISELRKGRKLYAYSQGVAPDNAGDSGGTDRPQHPEERELRG